jgi:predicted nucleic acid-binding protein
MQDKIFCDSNIFLYAFSKIDEDKKHISSQILRADCTISTQVINEVSNNLIKKLNFDNEKVKKFVLAAYSRYEVSNVTQNIFITACDIRAKYNFSYYDSLILSSALESQCDTLYSEDMQHNFKIEDLTIINPFTKEQAND